MDHHCQFCDRPCDPPRYVNRPFCDGECGPDFATTFADDEGRGWTIVFIDETDVEDHLFVRVYVAGKDIFDRHLSPYVEIKDGKANLWWQTSTIHETLRGVLSSTDDHDADFIDGESPEDYEARCKEMAEAMARVSNIIQAECEERGIWNRVVEGYRRAEKKQHQRDIEDFEVRMEEAVRGMDGAKLSSQDIHDVLVRLAKRFAAE